MSYAIGVKKLDGGIEVGPPHRIVFEEGDSLIVVKENDSPLQVSEKPARKMDLAPQPHAVVKEVSVLVIGVQPIIAPILVEYASYLHEGSTVCVASAEADSELASMVPDTLWPLFDECGIKLVARNADASKRRQLVALLDEFKPNCVLILADDQAQDPDAEDERILRTLLYLRDYRSQTGLDFSITSEMLLTQDKELAGATGPDDFIIGRQLSALLMAQIAEERKLASLFELLLSSEGFEVYMKPASRYVPLGEPVDLVSASEAAADKDEVFIGVRMRADGKFKSAEINPSKYVSDMQTLRQYVFREDDCFVVLAEDNSL